jgi:hypothetical protein
MTRLFTPSHPIPLAPLSPHGIKTYALFDTLHGSYVSVSPARAIAREALWINAEGAVLRDMVAVHCPHLDVRCVSEGPYVDTLVDMTLPRDAFALLAFLTTHEGASHE